MIIELNVRDEKADSFISYLKELDYVKINSKKSELSPITTNDDMSAFVAEDEDLSDCISSEEFKKLFMADLEKKYDEKSKIK